MTKGARISGNKWWLWRDAFRARYGQETLAYELRDKMLNTPATHPDIVPGSPHTRMRMVLQ